MASGEMRRKELFLLVARHAFADGQLDSREKDLLKQLQKFLRLPPEEARTLLGEAREHPEVGYRAPLEPRQLFRAACELAARDGELSEREKKILNALAQLLELGPEVARRCLQESFEGGAPPPRAAEEASPGRAPPAPAPSPGPEPQPPPARPEPPPADSEEKKKQEGDSAAAEERAQAFEQEGNWRNRGAVWGGATDDFKALWTHGWDYEWSSPIGRLIGALGLLFMVPATLTLLTQDLVAAVISLGFTGACGWLTFRKSDIRPRSARVHVLSELIGYSSRVLSLPPPDRPEVWQECLPTVEKLDNTYFLRMGVGVRFGMRWKYDGATDSYSRTRWFCIGHVPLVPLGRYRILDDSTGSFYVLAQMPLEKSDYAVTAMPWVFVALLMML